MLDSIGSHEQKMLDRLLNETTDPEEIPRLRGLLAGLKSAREAAETIVSYAAEAEEKANRELEQHV